MTEKLITKKPVAGTTVPPRAAVPQESPAGAPTGVPAAKSPTPFPGMEKTIAKATTGQVAISPAKAIAMAGQLYAQGKYGPATRVCRQILQRQPQNGDAHNILGVSLNAMGEPREAIASLRRAIKLQPKVASYRANLGEILRQNGDLGDAAVELEESLKLDSNNAQALNNLGIVQYDRKEYEAAVASYRAAIAIQPDMAEAYNNLGNALRLTDDREGAMEAYQNALIHREVYPEAVGKFGVVEFWPAEFMAYDEDDADLYPHAGYWDATGDTEYYEGE